MKPNRCYYVYVYIDPRNNEEFRLWERMRLSQVGSSLGKWRLR